MKNTITVNIRRFRELQAISQKYIATQMGITQSAYAKIESMQNSMTLDKLFLISEILEVDILHFFISTENIPKNLRFDNVATFIMQLQNEKQLLLNENMKLKNKYIKLLESRVG